MHFASVVHSINNCVLRNFLGEPLFRDSLVSYFFGLFGQKWNVQGSLLLMHTANPAGLGIGAASFWTFGPKDIADSPTRRGSPKYLWFWQGVRGGV